MPNDLNKNEDHQALLETLFQNAPLGFSFVDREFRFIRINHVLADIDGRSSADYLGKTVQEVIPSLWPILEPLFQRALAGETILNYDICGNANAKSEQVRHWLVSYFPIRHGDEITGIGGIVNDVTERKLAEAKLRVRNDMYAMLSQTHRAVSECQSGNALFQDLCRIAVDIGGFQFAWVGVPDGDQINLIASAGRDKGYIAEVVISLNENDVRSHGPTGRAAITGHSFVVNDLMASKMTAPWHDLAKKVGFAASAAFPLKERGNVVAVFNLYAATPGFFTEEMVTTLKEIMPSVSFALDKLAQDRDRIKDELELRASEVRLKALSRELIETREKELRHLARELHDEIGQMLTAMKMNLRGIQRECDTNYSERLDENIDLIDQAVQLVRNMALNMRPPHLEHLGLVPTLQWFLKSQSTIAGIQIHLSVIPAEIDISTDIAIVCFRIIQEAVTNAIRHAAPNRIDVELRQNKDELQVEVCDDGTGFDVGTALFHASRGASLGMISMQERASLVGGRVEFESIPGTGTTIRIWFPRSNL